MNNNDKTYPPRYNLFGVDYALTDYEGASDAVIHHAERNISFGVSALAVHGLVTFSKDKALNEKLKKIDLIVPDGQPVRWALNHFYKAGLKDRVYGPTLVLHVFKKADEKKLKIFLYGSTIETINKFSAFIRSHFPGIVIAGIHADRFRDATPEEDRADIQTINGSGAHIVLVGRGCPRQEVWVADHKGQINAAMMAVGAAFDFLSGVKPQAPKWMQKRGLEWLFRLLSEPVRLGPRYFITNTRFIGKFIMTKMTQTRSYK
ncbi:MAG: WecB/TagA/CpsF family glycosyltransferase [Chitinispirillaceae bacterium]|jgi:exopolysaccharide biosynthesis WecB/TagA/CpsF family protein